MNDFQIISKLGEGAYSIVHKVKRLVDGNIYALKKVKLLNLSEKEKLNALNEVRILASVKSNYVISYKEAFFDENESSLCIVMEYAEKGDLYQKIVEFKKAASYFEEIDIWRIFIQLTRGLKSLHDLKILHRDLKSANVFLFQDGSAKLGDLNVSKVARRGLGYTQTGTPYYASPEVWKDQPYDSKSDIWSLGCVLYEMITLRPPFRAENMEGLYNRVIKGQFNKISDRFSSDLSDIVKLLIQVQPETRPNCDQILKHPIIQKRLDFFKANGDETYESNLLQTIRVPKNLLFLTDRLPQPNYEKISNTRKNLSFQNNSLPEVKIPPNSRNKKLNKKQDTSDKRKDCSSDIAKDKPLEREPSPKARNVISLQPTRNDEVELLKKKLKISDNSPEHGHCDISNIRVIKPDDVSVNDSSMIKNNKDMKLPKINGVVANYDIQYDISIKKKEEAVKKKPKNINEDAKIKKILPYLQNEPLANMYQIYSPYMKGSPGDKNSIKKHKYQDKSAKYIKQLEKYYDYNVYKPKNILDGNSNHYGAQNGHKIIPNRKLSPIGKKQLIKI